MNVDDDNESEFRSFSGERNIPLNVDDEKKESELRSVSGERNIQLSADDENELEFRSVNSERNVLLSVDNENEVELGSDVIPRKSQRIRKKPAWMTDAYVFSLQTFGLSEQQSQSVIDYIDRCIILNQEKAVFV